MNFLNDNTHAENLQDTMKNPESTSPPDFQKLDSSYLQDDFGEELSFRHKGFMTTCEVADFLGISVSTVKNWRQRKFFGCYFFTADKKHSDTLYYKRERVEQL